MERELFTFGPALNIPHQDLQPGDLLPVPLYGGFTDDIGYGIFGS